MPRILIVDDEATIATHLEEKLTQFGFEVVGRAGSGESAVELARRLGPDLVLMDIVMHGKIDGIEASFLIKKEMGIPVVFLTAYGDDQFIKRAKKAEPLGYLIKPFKDRELKAAIEIALYNKAIAERLKDSEEQWRLLAENLQDGIILADSVGEIFFWNRGAEQIFKYKTAEALGRSLTFILPEGIRDIHDKEIRQMISGGQPDILKRKEIVGLKKDWSKFPLEWAVTPWKYHDQLFLICVVRDVTDQRREQDGLHASLEEKDALLMGIRSRVTTHLEVISSLIKLQFDYLQDRASFAISAEKGALSKSLGRMHEKLSRFKNFGKVDFGTYLQNLAGRLYRSYEADPKRIKCMIDAGDAWLDVQTAIPLGLTAAELISNALKYAFIGRKEGEIRIDFSREQETICILTVSDDGVGFPEGQDLRNAATMGLQIVQQLVDQMKGTIEMERTNGTRFRITFQDLEPNAKGTPEL